MASDFTCAVCLWVSGVHLRYIQVSHCDITHGSQIAFSLSACVKEQILLLRPLHANRKVYDVRRVSWEALDRTTASQSPHRGELNSLSVLKTIPAPCHLVYGIISMT